MDRIRLQMFHFCATQHPKVFFTSLKYAGIKETLYSDSDRVMKKAIGDRVLNRFEEEVWRKGLGREGGNRKTGVSLT